MLNSWQLSEEIVRAVEIAKSLAKERKNATISSPHFFKSLLHDDFELAPFLSQNGKDVFYLRDWADVRIASLPRTGKSEFDPAPDKAFLAVLKEAEKFRLKSGASQITPTLCFAALLHPDVGFTVDQLKSLPISSDEFTQAIAEYHPSQILQSDSKDSTARKKQSATVKYCIDKTALAKEGRLDPVIGREKEIQTIIEILGRRFKSNVLVIGEPGVGKTAIINGIASTIANGQFPSYLKCATVVELDIKSLAAGATYKGEFEDRLKKVFDEIRKINYAILFIDEIHVLLDKEGIGGSGAVDLIKPMLTQGDFYLIGTTTSEEFTRFIEPDRALTRRFEVVRIDQPSEELAFRMIEGIAEKYEKFHGLKVEKSAIAESIKLSKRYLTTRQLPDAAIDVIDQAMSAVKLINEDTPSTLAHFIGELNEVKEKHSTQDTGLFADELKWVATKFRNKISYLIWQDLPDTEVPDNPSPEALYEQLLKQIELVKNVIKEKKLVVDSSDIAAVVAMRTGIPIGKLKQQEREKLLNMEDWLKKRLIGQEYAIRILSEAVRESRSNLTKAGRPIGSFFFLGKTGTGKTELAKLLATFLFDNEQSLIRFDMSEFQEQHSAALLYGAPPGYVGYKEGGLLVNKIRAKPYSVLLFDEIEKAHPSVYDIFLQILDEGKLTDKLGKVGDFSNVIILFTSNVGSEKISSAFKDTKEPDLGEIMTMMRQKFRPEFIGRLTDVVPFAPLEEQAIVAILDLQLEDLYASLQRQKITLQVSPAAKSYLAKEGFSPDFGARPLAGVIRSHLRRPLARKIIANEVVAGSSVIVDISENGQLAWQILTN